MEQKGPDTRQNPGNRESDESSIKPAAEYVKAARAFLKKRQLTQAYTILLQAMALYPDHAIVLSYCGWLQAVVDKKYKTGIAACRRAFVAFNSTDPHTAGIVYPILYLNLGRAFLTAGRKKDAVENFNKGLSHDRSNSELKKELKLLGIRKEPFVPFLSRSNPINKCIGKILRSPARQGVFAM